MKQRSDYNRAYPNTWTPKHIDRDIHENREIMAKFRKEREKKLEAERKLIAAQAESKLKAEAYKLYTALGEMG